jgi:apolipoprotein N-acyltransferase
MPYLCPIAAAIGFALFFSIFSSTSSRKERFWVSAAWFVGVQLVQLSWMTSIEYQGYYILLVYLFLCFALGLQFGLLAVFLPQKMKIVHVFALSAFWTILEWSRVHISCGFSWNPIGLALGFHAIPLQWASLFGVFGLSFWVMLVNLWALKVWQSSAKRGREFCLWCFIAGLPYLFGALHLHYHSERLSLSEKTLHVSLVQTGLLPSEKVQSSCRRESYIPLERQWENILTYLNELPRDEKLDLIVLPEAVVPMPADKPVLSLQNAHSVFSKIFGSDVEKYFPFVERRIPVSNLFFAKTLANFYGSDVVLGLDHYDAAADKSYNSGFLASPGQEVVQRYDKRVLLPLAEYLPFKWLHPLTKSYGIYEFFSKGDNGKTLKGRCNVSVSICYEETFSEGIRRQVTGDTDLLINLTNDGYYPHSSLPEQHFAHARLRTVENGRPLLRSCNTGVTAAIDSLGRVIDRFGQKGEEFKRGVLRCTLNPYKYRTLYSIWGDGGIIGMSFGILMLFLVFKIFLVDKPQTNKKKFILYTEPES